MNRSYMPMGKFQTNKRRRHPKSGADRSLKPFAPPGSAMAEVGIRFMLAKTYVATLIPPGVRKAKNEN